MVIIKPENNFSSLKTQLLVNYVFTNDVSSLSLSKVTPDFDPIIGEIIESKEFTAKDGTMCIIHNKVGSDIKRVLLLGMGNRENLDTEKTRNLIGKVVNKAKELAISEFVLASFDEMDEDHLSAIVEGIKLSDYSFSNYKKDEDKFELNQVRILTRVDLASNQKVIQRSSIISDAVILTRDISNLPPNDCSPKDLANFAGKLSANKKTKVRVIDEQELEANGFGGIMAVGKGSTNSPKLIVIEYSGSPQDEKPLVIVGKAVTFDTGGISIKPPDKMEEMKFDKCGGCNVIGIMKAVSDLDLDKNVIGLIPAVENMPSGSSYRPGDIIKMHNGKTVEVLNTDAEGRIILGDAMAWAAEQRPDHLLEYSTLTGACVVALGQTGAGVYTPSDELAQALLGAAEDAGERLWRMPLWPEFKESLKGRHGDIRNVAGRWGGANTAAAFLSHFVGDVASWAHMDIAGPAYIGG